MGAAAKIDLRLAPSQMELRAASWAILARRSLQAGAGPACPPTSDAPAILPAGVSNCVAQSDIFARGAPTHAPETYHA